MAGKMKSRTRWRDKLEKDEWKIVDIPPRMEKRFGPGTMLIPKPLDVDTLIRQVELGKLITGGHIRETLAKRYHVTVTCPLVTGIFVRIAAETAEEDRAGGVEDVTPYWRVLKDDGSLNPKYPGGVEEQQKRLEKEGFEILPGKGSKAPRVKDFEKHLTCFD